MSQDDLQLPDDVEQLKAMIAGQAVAIAERDAEITQHETVIAAQHETIEKQLRKLEGLHQQLARLLRKQYAVRPAERTHRSGSVDAVFCR